MQPGCLTIILVPVLLAAPLGHADNIPDEETLVADAAEIGEIVIERENVFDPSNPKENNWLYRFANRVHIVTRDKVVRKQLLIASGDDYSKRLSDESERILRKNRYLYDVDIVPIRYENGVVDLEVKTRDLWSLMPELSWSRSGGENSTRFGLVESNLLGSGQRIAFLGDKNVDRQSRIFQFSDRHLGHSWVSASLLISDNSDGHSNLLSAVRPFYELDARWAAGMRLSDNDRRGTLYELGNPAAEYQQERDYYSAFYGWSRGLRKGRARRWTAGLVHDDNRFTAVPNGTLPSAIPSDRILIYPFLDFELIENRFETAKNRNQISQTEDFMMGRHLTARLGWSDTSYGADRDALIYSGAVSQSFGTVSKNALQLSVSAEGRIESGKAMNSLAHLRARYYRRQSDKHLFFASIRATAGHALDLDNPVTLGGDTGLRGFPLRYQNGESKFVATVEQRYFTDWYPFRLFRVGGAAFADVGRVWGDSPTGEERLGWLADAGFGLRLALTRSASGKVVHIDVAFPLNGDPSIDNVQFLIESRRSF
jgi:outer membrane protein assembly factor BamA